ncbi:MAG: peptidase S8 and S53 subtilisin kexin sedolisin, partial [Acidimicrobiaceae bacterium]
MDGIPLRHVRDFRFVAAADRAIPRDRAAASVPSVVGASPAEHETTDSETGADADGVVGADAGYAGEVEDGRRRNLGRCTGPTPRRSEGGVAAPHPPMTPVPRSPARSATTAPTGRRALAGVAAIAGAWLSIVSPVLADTPAQPDPVSDPRLLEAIGDAPSPSSPITVELVTDDTAVARRQAIALGGVITGSVPGAVVQVSIPAAKVQALASASAVEHARAPLIANRPAAMQAEFGPVTGENVAAINADDWHAAGITGAGVKVGIVDFFDLALWNPAEHGPLPDAAHHFCLDSSGSDFCPAAGVVGEEHGVAVAEVIKDMAPGAELYLATVGTVTDLRTAIDWFANSGVAIMTRSLGAAYDGPGDGTGPLAAAVDYAAAKGITWFNSAGNDAAGSYGRFTDGVDASGFVDFFNGPGVDTTLAIQKHLGGFQTCLGLDGVRWSDFGKAPGQVTDYRIEILVNGFVKQVVDANQAAGAPPIEGQDVV